MTSRITVALFALAFLGAGCFPGGGQKQSGPPTGGVWYSPDRGTSWKQVTRTLGSAGIGSNNTSDVLVLTADPLDANALYLGTKAEGLYFSYDSGVSWQQGRDLKAGPVQAIAVNPKQKCLIYAASTSRLYRSEDCNRTYQASNLILAGENISTIRLDWYNPDTVYVGSSGGALYRSLDAGKSWKVVYRFDSPVASVIADPVDSRILMVGLDGGGVFRSSDGGEKWQSLRDQLREIEGYKYVRFLFSDFSKPGRYIAATRIGLLETTDRGDHWRELALLTPKGAVKITALALDPKDGTRMYYAADKVIYRTANGAGNWETIQTPTSRNIGAILVHAETTERLYFGALNIGK